MPAATLDSMTIDELIEEFDDLGDWADQCEVLIDMGRDDLPPMEASLKSESNRVHGCQSNVWMVALLNESGRVELTADSDAMIVRGLLCIILMAFSNRTPQEILDTDITSIFDRLGLDRHLSAARKNGLVGMVKRVRAFAAEAAC